MGDVVIKVVVVGVDQPLMPVSQWKEKTDLGGRKQ